MTKRHKTFADFGKYNYLCRVKTMRVLFISLLFLALGASRISADPMDSVEISFLTCSPHNQVYSLYGHTALRIRDLRTGDDIAVNYGLFSFSKPHFVLRFVFGLTDYEMGIEPFNLFCESYKRQGRSITQQILDLTATEKKAIISAVAKNYLPENRIYRYNFFYDNCTTRARDMVVNHLDGRLRYASQEEYPSFREMIHAHNEDYRWARFGNDMLLGIAADRPTTLAEHQFLPDNTMNDLDRATVISTDGSERPLVGSKIIVVPAANAATKSPVWFTPRLCAFALLLIVLVVCAVEYLKHSILWGFDALLMTVCGCAGIILSAMLFSQHPTVRVNLQLLLLNPLPLFFLPRMIKRSRQHLPDKQYLLWIALTLLAIVASLFQHFAEGITIVALSLLIRNCWRYACQKRTNA